jgi:hypothetical protein
MYYDHVIIPVVWILQVRFNGLAMRDGLAISSQNLVFNSHSSSKISTLIVPLVGFFLGGGGHVNPLNMGVVMLIFPLIIKIDPLIFFD